MFVKLSLLFSMWANRKRRYIRRRRESTSSKMDGNKDESDRCFEIAKRCIAAGQIEKAVKFLKKAERLYPSQKAKGMTSELRTYRNKGLICEHSVTLPIFIWSCTGIFRYTFFRAGGRKMRWKEKENTFTFDADKPKGIEHWHKTDCEKCHSLHFGCWLIPLPTRLVVPIVLEHLY